MDNFLNSIRQMGARIRDVWQKLSLNQKVLFGGAVSLVLVALIVFLAGGGRGSSYDALYTELNEKDAAEIVQKLEEEKIAYRLADNGTTVLVPADQKYRVRLNLASQNLPKGEAGFELFQESSFGETQTDKKVKYQYALQGELARTIQSLDKVKAAKVNLALSEPSLFSDQDDPPKASVVIRTQDGESLSPKEVQAIVNLVANSVERLTTENVVIVDQNGNLVSDNLPSIDSNATEKVQMQMAMIKQYEKEKEQAIQSMLDKTLGKENSVVRVNAKLDFNEKEQTDEQYSHDDGGPFIRSEQITEESSSGTQPPDQGIPGTDNNIPEYEEAIAETGQTSYDRGEKVRNYEINRTGTTTRFSQGDVVYDYLTVSVLVNNAAVGESNLGRTEEEKIEKVRSIVAAACGLRENRPDENVRLEENISVAFIDFYTEPEPEPQPPGALDKLLKSPFFPLILAVAALAVTGLILLLVKRTRRKEAEEPPGFETVVEEEIRLEDLIDHNLTPEEKEKQKIIQEVDKMVAEDPEGAAQVIKTWLSED